MSFLSYEKIQPGNLNSWEGYTQLISIFGKHSAQGININNIKISLSRILSQTSFSLYLHNQWTDFHKLSCTRKLQIRAIHTYAGCTKAATND